jgi:hypothetical protein
MISGLSSAFLPDWSAWPRGGQARPETGQAQQAQPQQNPSAEATQRAEDPQRTGQARPPVSAGNLDAQLTEAEQKEVAELQKTDRAVRAHEQAHMSAGGGLVQGGATYDYQRGPDGKSYAVGGEVSISTAEGRTPDETVARARRIQAAALAPADPSGQDRAVAAQAAQMEMQALQEMAQAQNAGQNEGENGNANTTDGQRNDATNSVAGSNAETANKANAYTQISQIGEAENDKGFSFSAYA